MLQKGAHQEKEWITAIVETFIVTLVCVCYSFNKLGEYNYSWTTTLTSSMMKGNFLIHSNYRLIFFYFHFHFKECSQSYEPWHFCKYKDQFLLYIYIFFCESTSIVFNIYPENILVDKTVTIKKACVVISLHLRHFMIRKFQRIIQYFAPSWT